MEGKDICILCKGTLLVDTVTLREKGSNTINAISDQQNDTIKCIPGQKVHQQCQREYCHPNRIAQFLQGSKQSLLSSHQNALRSAEVAFSFGTCCLFCGIKIDLQQMQKRSLEIYPVATIEAKNIILKICSDRNDSWAESVRCRLQTVHDLPAADAQYHQLCNVNFRTGKQIPQIFSPEGGPTKKTKKCGRPQDDEKTAAFLKVVAFLQDHDDEQTTVGDLVTKMEEYLENSDAAPYSSKYMKSKLQEHFGNGLFITEVGGKANVVTFRNTAASILHDFHKKQKDDPITVGDREIRHGHRNSPLSYVVETGAYNGQNFTKIAGGGEEIFGNTHTKCPSCPVATAITSWRISLSPTVISNIDQ
jgi:hypothetical protein